jgi:RHS repeat-associated protein
VPQWSKSYIYLGNRLLSTLEPNGSGGEAARYYHPDRLGTRLITTAAETNPIGTTAQEQVALPFGTALDNESTGASKRRFTSYDRSAMTGLDYANNRHYDPQQGRFTQVDPAGMGMANLVNPQTFNLYAYCTNDPVNHTDPSGLGFFSFLKKLFKFIAILVAVVLIVIAVVTLGQAELLTTLQYFLSAGSILAQSFGLKKLSVILGIAALGLGIFNHPHSFGFTTDAPEEAGSLTRLAKILAGVGAVAAFLSADFRNREDQDRRRRERAKSALIVALLIDSKIDSKSRGGGGGCGWWCCFKQCVASVIGPEHAEKSLCRVACQICASTGFPPACDWCAACLIVAGATVEFCTLQCCVNPGCPAK